MTAQQRNGTTNSSPRSAVRRSRPSFCGSRRPRRTFGARSEKRGQRNAVKGARSGERERTRGRTTRPCPGGKRPPRSSDGRLFPEIGRKAADETPEDAPDDGVPEAPGTAKAERTQTRRRARRRKQAAPQRSGRKAPRATGRRRPTGRTRGRHRRRRAPGRSGRPKRRRKADYRRPRSTQSARTQSTMMIAASRNCGMCMKRATTNSMKSAATTRATAASCLL